MANGLKPPDERALRILLERSEAYLAKGAHMGGGERHELMMFIADLKTRLEPDDPEMFIDRARKIFRRFEGLPWTTDIAKQIG